MTRPVVVGVDIGGTKVLAGVVHDDRVLRVARRSAPGRRVDPRLVEDALTEAVLEAAAGAPLAAVGVAAAGFVDGAGERIVFAPHLPWRGEDVRRRLAERWGVPVVLENDATAAAHAEAVHGAARGAAAAGHPAVVVTLGTGIGGGVLLGGRVVRGASGMAGEFGHMQVVPDGHVCECGGRGCWEQYASGNALVRHARERMGGLPERLTGPMVTQAAEEGDPVARQAFVSVGHWLGIGLANLAAALDPAVLVVGGGVSAAGDLLLEPARAALAGSLVGSAHRPVPPVVRAALGPEAGLVGAAALAVAARDRAAHGPDQEQGQARR